MRTQRRRFIKQALSSLAIAGTPLFSKSFANKNSLGDKKIAIVGAGIAGLNCAYVLKKHGLQADVFEAADRVGGRIQTLRGHFSHGLTFELGAEWVNKGHTKMRALLAELALPVDDLFATNELDFETRTYFFKGQHYSPTELATRCAPLAQAMAGALRLAEESDAAFDALDAMSIDAWFNGQSDIDPVIRSVIENAYLSEFGLDTDNSSILNVLFLMDFQTLKPFRLQGDSEEGYHVHGGNDLLTSKLGNLLTNQIRLDSPLTAISETAALGCKLSFARGAHEPIYDHVVLAIPFTALRQVDVRPTFSPQKQHVINELGYGRHVKVCGEFSEKTWRTRRSANGYSFSDTPLQVTWESSVGQNTRAGLLTNIRGGSPVKALQSQEKAQVVRDVVGEMERIFPGLQDHYVAGSGTMKFWDEAPYAQGSYSGCGPGQWKWAGLAKKRHGNIHFAGEHCSIDNQGYMEGACESGEEAAFEILADLGIRPIRPYSLIKYPIGRVPSFRARENRILRKRLAAQLSDS